MPEISRFFGIVIAMYYDDHAPPHFHAIYGSEKAEISHRSNRRFKRTLAAPGVGACDGMGRTTSGGIARRLGPTGGRTEAQ